MKYLISSLLMLTLVGGQASAESIWKVEADNELYLFGTLHILRDSDFPLAPVYDRSFEHCDRLWLETDTSPLQEDPEVAAQFQAKMQLPEGEQLGTHLGADTLQALKQVAGEYGLPMAMLTQLKPWAVSVIISSNALTRQGFDVELGVDGYLARKAEQKGIPINYLEALLEQLEILDRAGSVAPEAMVLQTLDELENLDQNTDEIMHAWKTGDHSAMVDLMGMEDYPKVGAILLDQRNDAWMSTLLASASAGVTDCVAVGAAHMGGDSGLIRQFELAGYQVIRQSGEASGGQ